MISAGILPIGFCLRIESAASVGSAFSIVISLSRPRIAAASFTLRPNGEGGEERRIIMDQRSAKAPEWRGWRRDGAVQKTEHVARCVDFQPRKARRQVSP